jgi:hypothetical protein
LLRKLEIEEFGIEKVALNYFLNLWVLGEFLSALCSVFMLEQKKEQRSFLEI